MSRATVKRAKCCYRRVRVTLFNFRNGSGHCLDREEALELARDLHREASKLPKKRPWWVR